MVLAMDVSWLSSREEGKGLASSSRPGGVGGEGREGGERLQENLFKMALVTHCT